MSGELITQEAGGDITHFSLTKEAIIARTNKIKEVVQEIMVKDIHYGKLPGVDKPGLYKPGAEKLLETFQIAPKLDQNGTIDLSTDDCVRHRIIIHGVHQVTGAFLGSGVGECSSDEEKYKWRKPICDEEFNEAPEDRRREKWFKDKFDNYKPKKMKQVRTNPADHANTIIKMAKKRALVDLALTVTSASEMFTQDIEELPPELRPGSEGHAAPSPAGSPGPLTIKDVNVATGEKDGKPWKRYNVTDSNGEHYSTFSDTIGGNATRFMEAKSVVIISSKVGKFGNDLTGIVSDASDPVQPTQPAAPPLREPASDDLQKKIMDAVDKIVQFPPWMSAEEALHQFSEEEKDGKKMSAKDFSNLFSSAKWTQATLVKMQAFLIEAEATATGGK